MIAHFDIPFRMASGHAVVNDQDTLDDISACVEAIVRTIIGRRLEMPEFGIHDPTFQLQPIRLQPIIDSVLNQEPRASILAEQQPDLFDSYIARITARVSKKETASG